MRYVEVFVLKLAAIDRPSSSAIAPLQAQHKGWLRSLWNCQLALTSKVHARACTNSAKEMEIRRIYLEITSLQHEVRNHSVELASLVPKTLLSSGCPDACTKQPFQHHGEL